MKIKIKPIPEFLNELEINSVSVNLDQSAIIGTYVKNEVGMGYSSQLLMDKEAYALWGENDEYVVEWCLTQLNLEKE